MGKLKLAYTKWLLRKAREYVLAPGSCPEEYQRLANMYWQYPSDTFLDERLEEKIGKYAVPAIDAAPVTDGSVLHVATEIYGTGGHSRVLREWALHDSTGRQGVLLTNQRAEVPGTLGLPADRLIRLPQSMNLQQKALLLRDAAAKYEKVILHTHPDDLLPILAFRNNRSAKIFQYNHSDHVFWLNATIVDGVINFRPIGEYISRLLRGIEQSYIVPLFTRLPDNNDHWQTRSKTHKTFLSVVSSHKVTPLHGLNFCADLCRIATEQPAHRFILIGVEPQVFLQYAKRKDIPENVSVVPSTPHLTDYFKQADYYLETYPQTAGLGILDACAYGMIPIFNWFGDHSLFTAANLLSFTGMERFIAKDKEQYREIIRRECASQEPKEAVWKEIQDRIRELNDATRVREHSARLDRPKETYEDIAQDQKHLFRQVNAQLISDLRLLLFDLIRLGKKKRGWKFPVQMVGHMLLLDLVYGNAKNNRAILKALTKHGARA